ncbi:hypothetical protein EXIGLDRAFT_148644 [Exidia glandulosa HHB12029]|uniref:Uncharacterized protein n=1 Tax=Exidia glandulosa HHB12029 TaxID=1314781 RepID=A0A165FQ38_EXIGL|nr:hypothetical protein EXIGLDRAFT_148644 [Exidia glandulosa HHB12029]
MRVASFVNATARPAVSLRASEYKCPCLRILVDAALFDQPRLTTILLLPRDVMLDVPYMLVWLYGRRLRPYTRLAYSSCASRRVPWCSSRLHLKWARTTCPRLCRLRALPLNACVDRHVLPVLAARSRLHSFFPLLRASRCKHTSCRSCHSSSRARLCRALRTIHCVMLDAMLLRIDALSPTGRTLRVATRPVSVPDDLYVSQTEREGMVERRIHSSSISRYCICTAHFTVPPRG